MYRELNEIIKKLSKTQTLGEEKILIQEANNLLNGYCSTCKERIHLQSLISSYNLGQLRKEELIEIGFLPFLTKLKKKATTTCSEE